MTIPVNKLDSFQIRQQWWYTLSDIGMMHFLNIIRQKIDRPVIVIGIYISSDDLDLFQFSYESVYIDVSLFTSFRKIRSSAAAEADIVLFKNFSSAIITCDNFTYDSVRSVLHILIIYCLMANF